MKIYFDGGCRPNPGMMESAVVARGELHHRPDLGQGTSEQAEWHALLHALDVARTLGIRDLLLIGDALGVIQQVAGRARSRSPELHACREQFIREAAAFGRVRVRHIKRTQNFAGIALGHLRQGRRTSGPAVKESLP